ncbi:unknown [Mycoplasma sp. CAG:956]|nr:unknown [Mycoplasma sp. CAG:956]
MKDRIIELENGTMLYVLERETYQNKNYILGLKCDLKNDAIDTDNMLVLEVYTENNEIKTKSVDSDVVNNVVAALLTKFRKEK